MVMALHPHYLQSFLETNFLLLQSVGVLSYQYRNYIAIMAAARHQCSYLVHLMEAHFLLHGGDRSWLNGLEHVPRKLSSLSTLNKLLAHRPWLVTQKHIKELIHGQKWQLQELVQAIVLLCHFHSVAIFCQGTGVNLEIDHDEINSFYCKDPKLSSSDDLNSLASENDKSYLKFSCVNTMDAVPKSNPIDVVETLMERMKKFDEVGSTEEVTREEMNRRFEKEKEEASSQNFLPQGVSTSPNKTSYCDRYVIDPDFRYQDFAKRDDRSDVPTFRAQDYNWEDNAFYVVSNYYNDVAEMLDDKFKIAYNLTYKTLASKDNVDTTSLRRAIWKYVHCVYGIMYDDYNYDEVNQLLERSLKMFIKTVSCFPEQVERNVYDGFWKQFRHSEKVHVNIMLQESRFQVGLLYGLRALTQCITDS
ncbi:unnamed protein product [Clavelina lepadiformis]|uniref:Sestrin n=1 Tax=Clavelina lepadiformis TaxID=159417 RepID=A0ABP0FVS8_CLALP